jgi:hypothetical protein
MRFSADGTVGLCSESSLGKQSSPAERFEKLCAGELAVAVEVDLDKVLQVVLDRRTGCKGPSEHVAANHATKTAAAYKSTWKNFITLQISIGSGSDAAPTGAPLSPRPLRFSYSLIASNLCTS